MTCHVVIYAMAGVALWRGSQRHFDFHSTTFQLNVSPFGGLQWVVPVVSVTKTAQVEVKSGHCFPNIANIAACTPRRRLISNVCLLLILSYAHARRLNVYLNYVTLIEHPLYAPGHLLAPGPLRPAPRPSPRAPAASDAPDSQTRAAGPVVLYASLRPAPPSPPAPPSRAAAPSPPWTQEPSRTSAAPSGATPPAYVRRVFFSPRAAAAAVLLRRRFCRRTAAATSSFSWVLYFHVVNAFMLSRPAANSTLDQGRGGTARHVMGCQLTQYTCVQHACR